MIRKCQTFSPWIKDQDKKPNKLYSSFWRHHDEDPSDIDEGNLCPPHLAKVLKYKKINISSVQELEPIKHKLSILASEVLSSDTINYLAKVDTALMRRGAYNKPLSRFERGLN